VTEELLTRLAIDAFLAEYMHALDTGRLEEWHEFFTEDAAYRVTTRENIELGLPLSLMSCQGQGMFKDRISALRNANIYEPHVYCHIPGAMRITAKEGDVVDCESTLLVVRTMHDGEMKTFGCGRTIDRIRLGAEGPKFVSRTVILDSRQIDTLLVIPL
jgi:anthranilate 1,2-dioxygenase small subunit